MSDDEMEPGRWWSVIAPDGSLWCGTSDEEEARAAVRPGDRLQRLYVRTIKEWRDVETVPVAVDPTTPKDAANE